MADENVLPAAMLADAAGNPVEVTEHGEIKTSTLSLIMRDQVEGATLNTNIWTPTTGGGMTIVQSNAFLTLNANNTVTAGAFAMVATNKVVPFYGEQEVELSTSVKIDQLPDVNEVIEIGFFTATGSSAPTDGPGFIRITGGHAYGVQNFAGAETVQQLMKLDGITPNDPIAGAVQDYDCGVDSFNTEFEIDGNKFSISCPVTLPFPGSTARSTVAYRVYNKGTPPVHGCSISIGRMEVTQAIVTVGKPWPELLCEMGQAGHQSPTLFTTTGNQANSTVPATIALSNTTSPNAATVLDGKFKFAAVAGAETDYVLFAFQVPTGYQFKVTGVQIDTFTEGAAIGLSPTTMEWSIGLNSTGASLAVVDGAGTVAARRKALGCQTFTTLQAIGALAATIDRFFQPPLVVDSGRYVQIILRMPDGVATASLVFRGSVEIQGFFE